MINTILWDMDGVLVETSEAHYRSWLQAAEHFNFPFNREIFLRHYGMNNASTLHGVLGDDYLAGTNHRDRRLQGEPLS